ncbi:TrbI/VirB10 family protein [Sphingobium sp. Leaf26]|uniref:TrbI/VirB10 family protein n=1 Tax=Sphingobium sp. Leaf26 TaxID=1735693 RepID=UPI000AEDC309|nr:TrbI/VirB10 family protein [Sphingobium sp. Leaf26]
MTDMRREQADDPHDIRPLVGTAPRKGGIWIFVVAMAVAAGTLFYALEMRRERIVEPALGPRGSEAGMISAPPDLAMPLADMNAYPDPYPLPALAPQAPAAPGPLPAMQPSRPRVISGSQPWGETSPNYAPRNPAPPIAIPNEDEAGVPASAPFGPDAERVKATRFANPATTVPKGTVIQAVLETALDSTRPGFARGIVSRDVRSFDGDRILVPRGSRLIGEYKADLTAGQNRALILWQRLMRPDGVIISLDSPAADPLGRAGVKGKVNSHFFERFGGAILQSTLDIGVQAATRRVAGNTVILALPGASGQSVAGQAMQNNQQVQPTLKVRQGASVSVFVARDLDFTSVEQ